MFHSLGKYILLLRLSFRKPEKFSVYWAEVMREMVSVGIGSLGIISIISVFIGAATTIQVAFQLSSPLVPRTIAGSIARDSNILEFSPTISALVLAGRVGSSMASQIGTMRVTEQIDALEIMGINTKTYLVLPKIIAAMIMVPCLIVISIAVSIWGGYLAGMFSHILTRQQFHEGLTSGFMPYNLFFAIIKAFTFSLIISIIPSYYGYYVEGGALEIGRASTTSVVVSCVMILCADYGLSLVLL